MMDPDSSLLFEKIIQGDRIALGKAMTLVESDRIVDRDAAIQLLELCEKRLQQNDPSIRFAVSGAPGVGKSTFIEALGLMAIDQGHKVGVMTIDPTSSISHGSILGDKSRMAGLSTSPSAFVRSSPAGSVLGGMGRRSHEVMTLLAAAGYDLIFVETVGVGQSEHTAWQFTDGFILIVQPGGGDELQGIKRGITELADIVVVNKADGALTELARLAKAQYQNAMHFFSSLRTNWTPKTLTCSSVTGDGMEQILSYLDDYKEALSSSTTLSAERKKQKASWLHWTLGITANQLLINHPVIKDRLKTALQEIENEQSLVFKTAYDVENLMRSLIYPNHNNES
jgi:LAO/AO transport system kinase